MTVALSAIIFVTTCILQCANLVCSSHCRVSLDHQVAVVNNWREILKHLHIVPTYHDHEVGKKRGIPVQNHATFSHNHASQLHYDHCNFLMKPAKSPMACCETNNSEGNFCSGRPSHLLLFSMHAFLGVAFNAIAPSPSSESNMHHRPRSLGSLLS